MADRMQMGRVMRSMRLPDEGDRIVLWSWSTATAKRLRNIARLAHNDTVRWFAELPEGADSDCFVTLAQDGAVVVATTWSGLTLRLDTATGRALAL